MTRWRRAAKTSGGNGDVPAGLPGPVAPGQQRLPKRRRARKSGKGAAAPADEPTPVQHPGPLSPTRQN